jgi:hypothetical protein
MTVRRKNKKQKSAEEFFELFRGISGYGTIFDEFDLLTTGFESLQDVQVFAQPNYWFYLYDFAFANFQ